MNHLGNFVSIHENVPVISIKALAHPFLNGGYLPAFDGHHLGISGAFIRSSILPDYVRGDDGLVDGEFSRAEKGGS